MEREDIDRSALAIDVEGDLSGRGFSPVGREQLDDALDDVGMAGIEQAVEALAPPEEFQRDRRTQSGCHSDERMDGDAVRASTLRLRAMTDLETLASSASLAWVQPFRRRSARTPSPKRITSTPTSSEPAPNPEGLSGGVPWARVASCRRRCLRPVHGPLLGPCCRRSSPTWPALSSPQRAIDVGCGPGALTLRNWSRGSVQASVAAVDPSHLLRRGRPDALPGCRRPPRVGGTALPFDDGAFDAALAQLVVHFMADPVRGLAEMRRVTRPGGAVVACVWDHGGGTGPLGLFWEVARGLDPEVGRRIHARRGRRGRPGAAIPGGETP